MNEIEKYFEIYNNSLDKKCLFDENELRRIVENADSAGELKIGSNSVNPKLNRRKIIMFSSISIILITSLLFINSLIDNNPVKQNNQSVDQNSQQDKSIAQVNKTALNDKHSSGNDKDIESSQEINGKTYLIEPPSNRSQLIHKLINPEEKDISIVFGETELLKKLGIEQSDNGLKLTGEGKFDNNQLKKYKSNWSTDELAAKKYPARGIYHEEISFNFEQKIKYERELLEYNNWDMNISAGIYPLSIKIFRFKGKDNFSSFSSSFGYTPAMDDSAAKLIYPEISAFEKAFFDLYKKINSYSEDAEFQKNIMLTINKEKYPNVSKLIPLILFDGTPTDGNLIIMFYMPTKRNLELFKDELLKNGLPLPKEINYFSSDMVIPVKRLESKPVDNRKNLDSKFPEIILTHEEAEKFGIKFDGEDGFQVKLQTSYHIDNDTPKEALEMMSNYDYDINYQNGILGFNTIVNDNEIKSDISKYAGWSHSKGDLKLPFGITKSNIGFIKDENNRYIEHNEGTVMMINEKSPVLSQLDNEIKREDYDNLLQNSVINKIFPLTIQLFKGDKKDSSKLKIANVSLWYVASNEVIELLPARYKDLMKKEIELIASLENGKMTIEEVCKGLDGESIFNLCSFKSGALEIKKIFPQPADNELNIQIELKEERKITVEIYDINGKYYSTPITHNQLKTGSHSIIIDLSEINTGLYQLVISSDKNENVIERFIKK